MQHREDRCMQSRDHTIAVRGTQVRVLRGGKGPPLLSLHDTFCYTWMPVHERLATRYEVIVPIHPGCTGSGGVAKRHTLADPV